MQKPPLKFRTLCSASGVGQPRAESLHRGGFVRFKGGVLNCATTFAVFRYAGNRGFGYSSGFSSHLEESLENACSSAPWRCSLTLLPGPGAVSEPGLRGHGRNQNRIQTGLGITLHYHTARIGSLIAPKSGASEQQQPRPQAGAGASGAGGRSDTEDTDTERVWAKFRTLSGQPRPRGPGSKATCVGFMGLLCCALQAVPCWGLCRLRQIQRGGRNNTIVTRGE